MRHHDALADELNPRGPAIRMRATIAFAAAKALEVVACDLESPTAGEALIEACAPASAAAAKDLEAI